MEDSLLKRLNNAYNLLRESGIIHTRKELGIAIGRSESSISSAFKAHPQRLTAQLMSLIADAFPDVISREYMEHGVGEVAKKQGVPHIPYEVSAGGVGVSLGSIDMKSCATTLPISHLNSYDFTIDVHGDSMEPMFLSGDILACRWVGVADIVANRFYVLDTEDGAVVKMLEDRGAEIICTSLNKRYKEFSVPKSDALRVAIVVGCLRKFLIP